MKRFVLLTLACLSLLTALAPVTSAFADDHKNNFRKNCNGTKAC